MIIRRWKQMTYLSTLHITYLTTRGTIIIICWIINFSYLENYQPAWIFFSNNQLEFYRYITDKYNGWQYKKVHCMLILECRLIEFSSAHNNTFWLCHATVSELLNNGRKEKKKWKSPKFIPLHHILPSVPSSHQYGHSDDGYSVYRSSSDFSFPMHL